ncbi:hypothetical protein TNCV_247491, partial [Trichonephila clavipes]
LVDAPVLRAAVDRSECAVRNCAGSSGHEKVPTRGKPGLERPGRPREREDRRIVRQALCGPHSDLVQRYERARLTPAIVPRNNFKTPCRSKS